MRGFLKRFLPALLCLLLMAQGALAYDTLELGSEGSEVSRMQQALSALGYPVSADGVYGTRTVNAVKTFQADQGLKVDGKAGDRTLTRLYKLLANASGGTAAAPVQQSAASVQSARVYCADGGKLNLRSGAGSGFKALAKIPTGDYVQVISTGDKWSRVSYNGQTGYVMTSFLRFDGPAVTAAPAVIVPSAAPPAAVQAVVVCADGGKLNLRQTAGSGSKVLARIPSGTVLTVYPAGGKWYNTAYNGQSGYVQGAFLSFNLAASTAAPTALPAATPTPAALPAGAVSATVRCNGSLNLRAEASADAKVLGRIPNGAQLSVWPAGNGWYAASYNGLTGYVMAQYLQFAGGAAQAQPGVITLAPSVGVDSLQYEEFRCATVNAPSGTLNVRKGPGETYGRVSELRSGTQLMVSAIRGDWCAIYYGDIQGWTQKQYLSISAPNGAAQTSPVGGSGSYAVYNVDYNGNTSSAKTAAVRRAQTELRKLNYNVPLTGAFDARTHDALVAFQLRNGLTASGVLDSATQSALYSGSARDASSPSRYYLPEGAGRGVSSPGNVQLLHWNNEVSDLLAGARSITVYDPASGLSWTLSILSRGRHLDVEPATLTDTLIQKKSFGGTTWDVHPVYARMPDGRWTLATMHDYPHGSNTIRDNGFGGQNCVHFLRDMSEARKNDPSYGVRNQEVLRETWKSMTGITVAN